MIKKIKIFTIGKITNEFISEDLNLNKISNYIDFFSIINKHETINECNDYEKIFFEDLFQENFSNYIEEKINLFNEGDHVIFISEFTNNLYFESMEKLYFIFKNKNINMTIISISSFKHEGINKYNNYLANSKKIHELNTSIIKIDREFIVSKIKELTSTEFNFYVKKIIYRIINSFVILFKDQNNDFINLLKNNNELYIKSSFAIGKRKIVKSLNNLFDNDYSKKSNEKINNIILFSESSRDFYIEELEQINSFVNKKINNDLVDINNIFILNKSIRDELKLNILIFYEKSKNILEKEIDKKESKFNEINEEKYDKIKEDFSFSQEDDDLPFFMK